jgi:hypothetical protein
MSDKPKFDPSQPFEPMDKPKFDPSQPFEESKQPEMGWGEYIGRGATGTLPILGGAAAGAVGGTAAGPVGAVGGAGLGYAGGKEAEAILNHYLFNDEIPDTNPLKQAARVANNTATGAAMEMGGQSLAAGAKAVAEPVMDTLKSGAQKLADNAPQMVGNAIRKGGETFRLPFLSEKATGAIADHVAEPAENLTRSLINRFTGTAGEGATDAAGAVAEGVPKDWFFRGGAAREAGHAAFVNQEPAEVIAKAANTQFAAPLQQALQRGDDAYRSMVFLLGQQYPQFRKLMTEN